MANAQLDSDDTAKPFEFRRLVINTDGATPEACFRFTRTLDPASEAHYGDYLKIDPAFKVDVHVADKDLCIGGIDYATTYKVTLLKGLPDHDGDRLDSPETVDVALNDRPSLVSVSGDGYVLSRDTAPGVTIQTVNVNRVRIHVLRLSDKLLTSSLTQTRWNRLSLSATEMNRWQLRDLLSDAASVIWSGTMDIAQDHNRTVFTAFPLTGIARPGRNGIYLVVAENDAGHMPEKFYSDRSSDYDDTWGESFASVPAHWVMSTDMALTSLQGSDGLHVFVRSLSTALPVPKVDIRLVATGQDVLGKLTTGKDGQVVFPPGLLRGTRANKAASIVAYGPGGDFSVLDLNRPAFDLSDRGVSGRPSAGPLEAFSYTDRGIYRPGEAVHLVTLLRDGADDAITAAHLTLVLRRPDGVEANRYNLGPQPQGGFQQDIALSKSAARGMWSVDALVDPSSPPVGHVEFDVEDFVPQQLKVTLTSKSTALEPTDQITAALNGIFLYGAPAAGLKGEANLKYEPDPMPVPDAAGYHFGLANDEAKPAEQDITISDADDAGDVAISTAITGLPDTSLPLKAVLSAGLFEPSGRYVGTTLEIPVHNHPLLLGIKPLFDDYETDRDHPARFLIRAFDAGGKPVAVSKVHWSLVREDEVFDWFSTGNNNWDWHYHIVDHPVEEGEIDLKADMPLTFSHAVEWGGYRLIITDPNNTVSTSVHFNAGWESAEQAEATPDKLKIQVEKPVLAVGDTTRIQISAPFAGRAEVVIAGDRIFSTREIPVTKDGATFDVRGSKDWGSGAYVLVSLYRPLNEGRAHDPVRAIGVTWIGIDPKPRTLSLALAAPGKVTPRQDVTIPIKITGIATDSGGAGQTYLTLSAVDEGILQLTRFQTPDPTGFFMGKRRLGLDIRDLYGQLMESDGEPGAPHEGGDTGGGDLGGPGLAVESTRTIALFSGVVALKPDGTVEIPVHIPDFEGQLRLMAVAYNATQTGKAESTLIVRDPVIADVALPRFLAPGDQARLAISLHNTDGATGRYHLEVTADGPATITADHKLDYTLPAGKRLSDAVLVKASDIGVSTIRADLTGPDGYKVHREWQIAVRSPHYPVVVQTVAEQKPGDSFKIDPAVLAGLVPGSLSVSLGYSNYSGIDAGALLQSLWTYPFGCTEQTVSTAFPLLYFNDPALLGSKVDAAAVKNRVQDAIDTIVDRQDASGEFGLWEAGDQEASPWLNVYAVDFLMHAKEAGFSVPDATLKRSYSWLQIAVRDIENQNEGYYAQAPITTLAYAEYVLARAGHADIGLLRRLHDTMIWQTPDGNAPATLSPDHHGLTVWSAYRGNNNEIVEPIALAQMAGAFALLGDHARANDSLQLAIANIGVDHWPEWWFDTVFYSENRDLAALIEIEAEIGNTDAADNLVQQLNDKHIPVDQLTTQDKAWLLMAAHALNQTGKTAHLTVNGKDMTAAIPLSLSPDAAAINAGFGVTNAGDKPIWRSLTVTGTPVQAPAAAQQGYEITKAYYKLDGSTLDPSQLRQNDRFIIVLHGTVNDDGDHRTVVVDPLPAGWEIEKTLRPSAQDQDFDFVGALTKTRVMEARDDRFLAAFDIGTKWQYMRFRSINDDDTNDHLDDDEFRVAYLVRVVTPGTFVLPEAIVQDMYRPSVNGRTDGGQTVATPR